MPRLIHAPPKYRKHKASGQAVVTINGRDHYLGLYRSKASRREYDRLVGEWLARDRQPLVDAADGLLVSELAARYWSYATQKYVRHGQPTAEQHHVKTALKHLLRLYENHIAAEFGPTHLKVVRQSMIEAGWARNYINGQVGVLVRMFKWGVTEGLLPASVHAALDLVDGLRRGESAARETCKRHGVDDPTVAATLPYLSPIIRAMIELQRATGARPGEICVLRPEDVDRSGIVWEYRPMQHKGELYDRDRCIYIGPKGQDILRPFLLRPADSFCFSPAESMEWHRSQRHDARKTPENCGNTIGTNRKRGRSARCATSTTWPATGEPSTAPATWRGRRRRTSRKMLPLSKSGKAITAGRLTNYGTVWRRKFAKSSISKQRRPSSATRQRM